MFRGICSKLKIQHFSHFPLINDNNRLCRIKLDSAIYPYIMTSVIYYYPYAWYMPMCPQYILVYIPFLNTSCGKMSFKFVFIRLNMFYFVHFPSINNIVRHCIGSSNDIGSFSRHIRTCDETSISMPCQN